MDVYGSNQIALPLYSPNGSVLFLLLLSPTSGNIDEGDNEAEQNLLRLYHHDRGADHGNL